MTGAASYPLALGVVTAVLITAISWLAISVTVGEAPFYISIPAPQGFLHDPQAASPPQGD